MSLTAWDVLTRLPAAPPRDNYRERGGKIDIAVRPVDRHDRDRQVCQFFFAELRAHLLVLLIRNMAVSDLGT
jgi:hypothetical protein